MRKPRSTVVFLVLLLLGISLAVPAKDIPETAYDESDAQPSESAPLISDALPSPTASATERCESPMGPQSASPYGVTATRTDGRRPAEARVALAFLCTLLC